MKEYWRVSYMITSKTGGSKWSEDTMIFSEKLRLLKHVNTVMQYGNFAGVLRVDPCDEEGENLA